MSQFGANMSSHALCLTGFKQHIVKWPNYAVLQPRSCRATPGETPRRGECEISRRDRTRWWRLQRWKSARHNNNNENFCPTYLKLKRLNTPRPWPQRRKSTPRKSFPVVYRSRSCSSWKQEDVSGFCGRRSWSSHSSEWKKNLPPIRNPPLMPSRPVGNADVTVLDTRVCLAQPIPALRAGL